MLVHGLRGQMPQHISVGNTVTHKIKWPHAILTCVSSLFRLDGKEVYIIVVSSMR
ncbi:hypothetical protein CsSME_00040778 [Camellia sinensis var. sinensis]